MFSARFAHMFVNHQLAASQQRCLVETITLQLYCRDLPVYASLAHYWTTVRRWIEEGLDVQYALITRMCISHILMRIDQHPKITSIIII